jgi:hypothetical protein
MAHAPFSHSDGRFNLTQHLSADLTDSLAKLCDGGWGVPVQHLCEILPEQLRIQSAPGLDAVGDAGGSGLPEGSSDAEIIILSKLGSVHAVADVTGMIPPVFQCLLLCDLINLLLQSHCGIGIILILQHLPNRLHSLIRQHPGLHIPGIAARASIRYVKNIPDIHAIGTGCQQRDSLGAAPDIPPHGVVPKIIGRAGCGIRTLSIDHQLIMEGILVQP